MMMNDASATSPWLRRSRLPSALLAAWLCTGCAALYPSKVQVPVKPADGKTWATTASAMTGISRIPKTTELAELQGQLAVYSGFWRDVESRTLFEMRDAPGRARDLLVLWGAYEAVMSHFRSARYAGIGAALFGSVATTYKVELQAANYQTAADAMDCIATEVERVPRGAWKFYDDEGTFTGGIAAANEADLQGALLELNDVYPAVNRSMNQVLTKLLRAQMNELRLSGVNLEELRNAYDREREIRDKAVPIKQGDNPAPAIAGKSLGFKFAAKSESVDNLKAATTALRLLRLNAAKCVSSTAG